MDEGRRLPRLAWIFLAALALRLFYLWEMRDSILFEVLVGDGEGYERSASELLQNGWRVEGGFYQAPLYPFFLAAVHALWGPGLAAVRFVQAFLGAASCVLLADATGRFFDRRAGAVAGWLLALYAPAIFHDGAIEKTSLALFALTVFLAVLARARSNPTPARAGILGLTIGVLSLLRDNLVVLIAVVAIWLWLARPERRAAAVAALLLGVALIQAPFVAENYAAIGSLSSGSHLGANLYIGNNPRADGLYVSLVPGQGNWEHERENARILAEREAGHSMSPGAVSLYWARRAIEWAAAHPLDWARLTLRKLHYTFHAREWMDSQSYEAFRSESALLRALGAVLRFGLLVPLAAVGIWSSRRDRRDVLLLYGCIAAVTASIVPFFVFARFRFPLVPLLLPFCALALSRPRRAASKGGALVFVATLALVHLPVAAVEHPIGDTYNNVAGKLTGRGEPERALPVLRTAIAGDPGYAPPHVNLAVALTRLGRLREARESLQRAVELGVEERAYVEMAHGQIDAMAGDLRRALERFEVARRLSPSWPEVHLKLGLVHARLGSPAAAEAAYREALRLRPGYADAHNNLGYLLQGLGRFGEAGENYELALQSDPEHRDALVNLAWLRCSAPRARDRDGRRALELAQRVVSLLGEEHPDALDLLAAASAEAGDFERAVDLASRAIELARAAGRDELARGIEARRSDYERGLAHRE